MQAKAALLLVWISGLCLCGCSDQIARQVSASGSGAYEATLAAVDEGLIIGWYDTRDGNPEVYARLLALDGTPRGPEWKLTTSPAQSYEPDVAATDDGFAVAWYDVTDAGESFSRLGLWEADGSRRWELTMSAAGGSARNPVVVSAGDRLFVAWLERDRGQWAVWARWFDVRGQALTSARRLASAGETTWNLNAALDESGSPWVVFDAVLDTAAAEVFAVQLAEGGPRVVQLTRDDGTASTYPDIAFEAGRAAVTWFDERDGNREVYLAAVTDDALPQGIDAHATRVTFSPGESIGAYVAWNGPQIGLAWSDDSEGNHEVFFQRFTALGVPVHGPIRVTTNTTASWVPAIQSAGAGFALGWNEDVVEARGSHADGGRSEVVVAVIPPP